MSITEATQPVSTEPSKAGEPNTQGAFLRVQAEKVGRLMDLVGELSLGVSEVINSPDLAGLELTEFEKSAHRLKTVVHELQDASSELRLVAIGEIFRRMRRMVRELERQTNKKIELVLVGEDTEVDKLVADRLYEPLVHVLRNSADHGLEMPDERIAAGKSETGRITLSAVQLGGEIQITVSDDGRGLNRERILARARERGFFGANEDPEDHALWKVIFQPGFSTAEVVTNLSGRGVGMDVLHTTMKELRGRITVDSKKGIGANVNLSIPLTLAFLDCLVMRVGERLYAAPVDMVNEVFRPEEEQISTISAEGGAEMIRVREKMVPVCRLQRFYGEDCSESTPLNQMVVVVFQSSAGRFALPVDEMFDQQQVVMKPLQGRLEKIRASMGCALLGTGEIAIVLDCEELARGSRK